MILKVTGCPTTVLLLLSVAKGGRLTTSNVILAGVDTLLLLSATVYGMVTSPINSGSGVKVRLPSSSTLKIP